MVWKPDVTVAAVIESDGRYLVVEERVGGRIVVNQPAGHLENGETFTDAVIRETVEETGWTFVPDSIVGIYLWRPETTGRSFLRVAFSGNAGQHDPARPLDRGIVRTRWLTREQLAATGPGLRSPLVLRCVDDHRAGTRHPLSLISHLLPASKTSLVASA